MKALTGARAGTDLAPTCSFFVADAAALSMAGCVAAACGVAGGVAAELSIAVTGVDSFAAATFAGAAALAVSPPTGGLAVGS